MKYQIMFYAGIVVTLITFILSIVTFIKLNAAEALGDLIGVNLKSKSKRKKDKNKSKAIVKKQKATTEKSKEIEKNIFIKEETKVNIIEKSSISKDRASDVETNNMVRSGTIWLGENETNILGNNICNENEEETNLLENTIKGNQELDEDGTTIIDEEDGTMLLDEDGTILLDDDSDETTLIEIDNGFEDRFVSEIDVVLLNTDKEI